MTPGLQIQGPAPADQARALAHTVRALLELAGSRSRRRARVKVRARKKPASPPRRRAILGTYVKGRYVPPGRGVPHPTAGRRRLRDGTYTRRVLEALKSVRKGRTAEELAAMICEPRDPRRVRTALVKLERVELASCAGGRKPRKYVVTALGRREP